jgi:hypothetical protein
MLHPSSPQHREASGMKDCIQAVPVDRVKCLGEIKLDNKCGSFPLVAALYQLCCIDKVLRYGPSFDKPRLVDVD